MGTKETQAKILAAALKLFNAHGTAKVSPLRIANAAGLSKGNLNYHYRKKGDLILDLFLQMHDEIQSDWHTEDLKPTMEYLSFSFFRELVPLLRADPILQRRWSDLRRRRLADGQRHLDGLVAQGLLRRLGYPNEFDLLTANTWLLTNHWLNYVESTGEMDDQALLRGYQVMLNSIRPYATERGLRDFERLADPQFSLDEP
jgi:AcrR family transcriptional regulator